MPSRSIARVGLIATAISLLAGVRPAVAQDKPSFHLDDYEFLERQYIFWSPQKIVTNGDAHYLGFEAQVGPHVPLFGGPLDQRDPVERLHWEGRFIFTFQSVLRLSTADSTPVVTPSYRPQFRLQFLGSRVHGRPATGHWPTSYRWGVTVDVWSHHSNGQDGCTFSGPVPPGATCPEIGNGATGINERTGGFGTDYSGLTLDGRYSWGTRPHSQHVSLSGKIGGQVHHNFPGAGLIETPDGDLTRLWGRFHGLAGGEVRWNIENEAESWAGDLYARYRLDLASSGSDARLSGVTARLDAHTFELGWICTRLFHLGLFARVVAGRDYYNIEFTQSPTRLQFGLVIDTSGSVPAVELKPLAPP